MSMLKRTLALVSAISLTSILYLLREKQRNNLCIIALTQQANVTLKQHGLSPIMLNASIEQSWAERDKQFADIAMPGVLDFNIPGTDLPAWKVLALDRLSFWFAGAQMDYVTSAINAISHNKLVVSLDTQHPIPWYIASLEDAIAIQCGSIRTREILDLSTHMPFVGIVVRNEADANYLRGICDKDITSLNTEPTPQIEPATQEERIASRALLGIEQNTPVALVIYDSQVEYATRVWMEQAAAQGIHLLILPTSENSRNHLYSLCPQIARENISTVIDNLDIQAAANEAIMFRFTEEYATKLRIPVRILDSHDRFKSGELIK